MLREGVTDVLAVGATEVGSTTSSPTLLIAAPRFEHLGMDVGTRSLVT